MKTPQQELLEVQEYLLNQFNGICGSLDMSIPFKGSKESAYSTITICYRNTKDSYVLGSIYYFAHDRIDVCCSAYSGRDNEQCTRLLESRRYTSLVDAVEQLNKVITGFRLVTE